MAPESSQSDDEPTFKFKSDFGQVQVSVEDVYIFFVAGSQSWSGDCRFYSVILFQFVAEGSTRSTY